MTTTMTPNGALTLRTLAMPADTNRYGDIFGGWLLGQMDLAGAIAAHGCSHNRMTTVAVDSMVFIKPVYVGDVVSCFAEVSRKGNTSVTISVEAWVQRHDDQSLLIVTKGLFTYVAIDKEGRPTSIKWLCP